MSMVYYNYFLNRQIKIFNWSFNIKLSKIYRTNIQRSREYSRPEKHEEPIQHNLDLHNFHTTVGYKFSSSSHKLGDTGTHPRTLNKVQKCHGLKVSQSILSSLLNYVRSQYQKIFKITSTFSSSM